MHPADIQAELKKVGITQYQIASDLGVSGMSVSKEVNKVPTSEKIREAIAKAIGKDRREVFPEYYFRKNRRQKAA